MPAFETIKKRRDFLAVRGGEKASSSAFLIEAKRRRTDETAGREQLSLIHISEPTRPY